MFYWKEIEMNIIYNPHVEDRREKHQRGKWEKERRTREERGESTPPLLLTFHPKVESLYITTHQERDTPPSPVASLVGERVSVAYCNCINLLPIFFYQKIVQGRSNN